MAELMMCSICFRICDQNVVTKTYVHAETEVGLGDHEAVPVPYDATKARILCDICRKDVTQNECWTVPCRSFVVAAMIDNQTLTFNLEGHWAACPDCAVHIFENDWETVTDDILAALGSNRADETMVFIQGEIIKGFRDNISGPIRKYRPGDEIPTDV